MRELQDADDKSESVRISVVPLDSQQPADWKDPSSHVRRFVTVSDNVRLEVLDWGGSGRPLVLLPGGGDTAHVFDEGVLIAAGLLLGLSCGLWAARFVEALLFQLEAPDPVTFVASAAVLVAASALAAWMPARRAARLDPATVLREG